MTSSKRDHARIELRLIASLTEACEAAKVGIVGFDWISHEPTPSVPLKPAARLALLTPLTTTYQASVAAYQRKKYVITLIQEG